MTQMKKNEQDEDQFSILTSAEKADADQLSGAMGMDEKPHQQMSLETFTTVVIVSTLVLVFIYGVLLPVPNPTQSIDTNINSTAINNTVNSITGASSSNDLSQDLGGIFRNQYNGSLRQILIMRLGFSVLMIICFIVSYRYVKKSQSKSYLLYIFIFTSMVGTSGPIGVMAVVLGGGGIIGGAVGGLLGALFAFWKMQDRGFIA